jgi:hypothetical protein
MNNDLIYVSKTYRNSLQDSTSNSAIVWKLLNWNISALVCWCVFTVISAVPGIGSSSESKERSQTPRAQKHISHDFTLFPAGSCLPNKGVKASELSKGSKNFYGRSSDLSFEMISSEAMAFLQIRSHSTRGNGLENK